MDKTVIFCGYAPVHFICFLPIYQELKKLPELKIYITGMTDRKKSDDALVEIVKLKQLFPDMASNMLDLESASKQMYSLGISAGSKFLVPQNNCKKKLQIFHGISFRNRGLNSESLSFDYIFAVGPYMQRTLKSLGVDDKKIVNIGFPKTDALVKNKCEQPGYQLNKTKKTILIAPTGQAHNLYEVYGKELLKKILVSKKYNVIFKPHDHPQNKVEWEKDLADLKDDGLHLYGGFDIQPLFVDADLLITDASSVANEFTLVDKPILFMDVPELIGESYEKKGVLDLVTWGRKSGFIVNNVELILDYIELSFNCNDLFKNTRNAIANDLFFNRGMATNKAVSWIEQNA